MTEKIFLINPSDKHLLTNAGDRWPLGVLYLSSFLKNNGYATRIWDLNHDSEEEMLTQARNIKYFCIAIATPIYLHALNLAQKIRQKTQKVIIIAGGNHVTDMPNEASTLLNFDYVIVGDGEEGLLRILTDQPKTQIIYSKPIQDLDTLPFPDYEGIKMERYIIKWMVILLHLLLPVEVVYITVFFAEVLQAIIR